MTVNPLTDDEMVAASDGRAGSRAAQCQSHRGGGIARQRRGRTAHGGARQRAADARRRSRVASVRPAGRVTFNCASATSALPRLRTVSVTPMSDPTSTLAASPAAATERSASINARHWDFASSTTGAICARLQLGKRLAVADGAGHQEAGRHGGAGLVGRGIGLAVMRRAEHMAHLMRRDQRIVGHAPARLGKAGAEAAAAQGNAMPLAGVAEVGDAHGLPVQVAPRHQVREARRLLRGAAAAIVAAGWSSSCDESVPVYDRAGASSSVVLLAWMRTPTWLEKMPSTMLSRASMLLVVAAPSSAASSASAISAHGQPLRGQQCRGRGRRLQLGRDHFRQFLAIQRRPHHVIAEHRTVQHGVGQPEDHEAVRGGRCRLFIGGRNGAGGIDAVVAGAVEPHPGPARSDARHAHPGAGQVRQVALEGHGPGLLPCRPCAQRGVHAQHQHVLLVPRLHHHAQCLRHPRRLRCADCATAEVRTCAARTCNRRSCAAVAGMMAPTQSTSSAARRAKATRTRNNAPALREWNLMLLYYGASGSAWRGVDAAIAGV